MAFEKRRQQTQPVCVTKNMNMSSAFRDGKVASKESQNGTDQRGKLQDERKVGLGKKVTLFRGIAFIVGTIIGAGIFISPKGILKHSGSVGMSLMVWIACGVLSLFGELRHIFVVSEEQVDEQTFCMHTLKKA